MTFPQKAKWIWLASEAKADEYGEFFASFTPASGGQTVCRLSCDGDYTLFVNGAYAASNQYGDFPHYKIYDEIDITPYLTEGENRLMLLVWHLGNPTQRYRPAEAGVIFEVEQNGTVLAFSDEGILCRQSPTYRSHYNKWITDQLGCSFLYDAKGEGREAPLAPAVAVVKTCTFFPRPLPKLTVQPPKAVTVLRSEGTYYLVDLGEETVGLPVLELFSDTEQTVTVTWGEDLQDGHPRWQIGPRNFSLEYQTRVGENRFSNYMLRLGCRYLELYTESPVTLRYLGLRPQEHPVEEVPFTAPTPRKQAIYDLCIKTLRLCMMEHYVDTPWREQCLYAYDSRNQMLCGYYAFADGNAAYARANLLLMSKDEREDGLLSICYPCGTDLAIPSFSLYYFIAVKEYGEHIGDLSLAEEVYPKLLSVAEVFLRNRKEGLVYCFDGAGRWNFYDWSPHLSGHLFVSDDSHPDLVLNCLFILAMESLKAIAASIGEVFPWDEALAEVRVKTDLTFWDESAQAYAMTEGGGELTVLGNALAILAGVARDPKALCESLIGGAFSDCSLSMKCFPYDALLRNDREKYAEWIDADIEKNFGHMLDVGATSVWETLDGAQAFGHSGSLCHGWSALPVYYYRRR